MRFSGLGRLKNSSGILLVGVGLALCLAQGRVQGALRNHADALTAGGDCRSSSLYQIQADAIGQITLGASSGVRHGLQAGFVTDQVFGKDPAIKAAIFQQEHQYLLGIRTPQSRDFNDRANSISNELSLPLRWTDVSLDHLEQTLRSLLADLLGDTHV